MRTETGEYIVGAYLEYVEKCDLVLYNVRPSAKGRDGQAEFDVVGLKMKDKKAILCEVTTHIRGLLYVNEAKTEDRLKAKMWRLKDYAGIYLGEFTREFMFWSPVVKGRYLLDAMGRLREDGVQVIVNEEYANRVQALADEAAKETRLLNNPFMRSLQILTHLRKPVTLETAKAVRPSA